MRLPWVVRVRSRGLGVRETARGGLIAAVLLSCLLSLLHLSSLGLPQGDGELITLKGRGVAASLLGTATKAGVGAAAALRSSLSSAAGRGVRGSSSSSLVQRDALLAAWPPGKPRAAVVVLCRNIDLGGVVYSMEQLERRFNSDPGHRYPYIFLNDQPHTPKFRAGVAAATSAPCLFGTVPIEHWSYPDYIDQVLLCMHAELWVWQRPPPPLLSCESSWEQCMATSCTPYLGTVAYCKPASTVPQKAASRFAVSASVTALDSANEYALPPDCAPTFVREGQGSCCS